MRKLNTLAILAPAALALSACGGSEADVPESDTAAEAPAAAEADTPAVPADPRATVDFAGTYEKLGEDGRKVSLTLNDDDTYSMVDGDKVETTGTYNWYSDNRRILIKEGEETMVYAVGDGALYKLDNADVVIEDQIDEAHMWRKAIRL